MSHPFTEQPQCYYVEAPLNHNTPVAVPAVHPANLSSTTLIPTVRKSLQCNKFELNVFWNYSIQIFCLRSTSAVWRLQWIINTVVLSPWNIRLLSCSLKALLTIGKGLAILAENNFNRLSTTFSITIWIWIWGKNVRCWYFLRKFSSNHLPRIAFHTVMLTGTKLSYLVAVNSTTKILLYTSIAGHRYSCCCACQISLEFFVDYCKRYYMKVFLR